jgi:pyruvate/2-oxoglutarate dehydrogenase complex dihydrolipoamide acyltransferase (E2) component
MLESANGAAAPASAPTPVQAQIPQVAAAAPSPAPSVAPAAGGGVVELRVPDIGDFKDVSVIEVFIKPGDTVNPEDPLVTLESDKATMDVPSPAAGVVEALRVKVGDRVSEGSVLALLASEKGAPGAETAKVTGPDVLEYIYALQVMSRVEELSPMQREFLLAWLELDDAHRNDRYERLAEQFAIPMGTVRSRLSRLRDKLAA